jgi:hypothetical protein
MDDLIKIQYLCELCDSLSSGILLDPGTGKKKKGRDRRGGVGKQATVEC